MNEAEQQQNYQDDDGTASTVPGGKYLQRDVFHEWDVCVHGGLCVRMRVVYPPQVEHGTGDLVVYGPNENWEPEEKARFCHGQYLGYWRASSGMVIAWQS